MVHKLMRTTGYPVRQFENDVKQYGTQAFTVGKCVTNGFENDVKQYGTQASRFPTLPTNAFENDVKQYGTQADT